MLCYIDVVVYMMYNCCCIDDRVSMLFRYNVYMVLCNWCCIGVDVHMLLCKRCCLDGVTLMWLCI